ncbi:MAG: hypothetical protein WAX77_00725 [Methylococcaceae bacterium]
MHYPIIYDTHHKRIDNDSVSSFMYAWNQANQNLHHRQLLLIYLVKRKDNNIT